MLTALYILGGMALLVAGAELMLRGAVRLATMAGISPLVVGLTVVAYGTSAPEMAVCAKAAIAGQGSLALGNVVGANLLNILLILGISSLIGPLIVARQLIRVELPMMIGASLALWLISLGEAVRPWHGIVLVVGLAIYTVAAVRSSRRQSLGVVAREEINDVKALAADQRRGLWWNLLFICLVPLGIFMLVIGSDLLVKGAVSIAQLLGVSEVVIGLTVVAIGTTAPEMTTSVVASLRGHRDIAVGNVVGSNMCNIMAVLAVAAIVGKGGIVFPQTTAMFDIPVMVAASVVCLPVFVSGLVISRKEGAFLLLCYVAYTIYQIAIARHPAGALDVRLPVLVVIIPMAVVWTLLAVRRNRRAQ